MRALFRPAHLLTFDKSFTDHLIDRRLYKPRRDLFPVPISISIIGNKGVVGLDVVGEILHCLNEFREIRTGFHHLQFFLQVVQFLQRLVDIAMPQRPFEPLQQSVDPCPSTFAADP